MKAARRIAAATLVQWTAGGSIGNAARYLGFNPGGGQYAPTNDLARWLAALEPDQFTRALREITLRLDQASGLVNYQRRRQTLQDWALTDSEWNDIISRLPPVPGPNQPILDDRKRQEASAFVWARVTQGEPRFAPRPIEASQHDPVRRVWTNRRANTWHRLDCPGRIVHYTELRSLLIEHADQLARDIDDSTEATDKALAVGLAGTAVTTRLPTLRLRCFGFGNQFAKLARQLCQLPGIVTAETCIEQKNGTDTALRGQLAITVTGPPPATCSPVS